MCIRERCNLGLCYDNGEGVEQDKAEGVRWYRKAAEQSHVTGQFNLGVSYEHGTGVEQDHAEAVRWYGEAAENGHARGRTSRDRLTKKLEARQQVQAGKRVSRQSGQEASSAGQRAIGRQSS